MKFLFWGIFKSFGSGFKKIFLKCFFMGDILRFINFWLFDIRNGLFLYKKKIYLNIVWNKVYIVIFVSILCVWVVSIYVFECVFVSYLLFWDLFFLFYLEVRKIENSRGLYMFLLFFVLFFMLFWICYVVYEGVWNYFFMLLSNVFFFDFIFLLDLFIGYFG